MFTTVFKVTKMDFKNKIVVITGASSGIGAAIAIKMANLSAKLVLCGRNEANLKKVATEVEIAKGMKPLVVKADMQIDEEVKKIMDETVKKFGAIDVLINNAGAGVMAGIKDGIEPFDKMISTNLRSAYLLTHHAIPLLIKSRGVIVNVSSIAAMKPFVPFMPYCISKAGMDMFTKCLAKEVACYGIRVVSVNPGPVESDFHARLGLGKKETDHMMKEREEASPLKRVSTSEEIADMVLFVASDIAKSFTGSCHVVDNGYML